MTELYEPSEVYDPDEDAPIAEDEGAATPVDDTPELTDADLDASPHLEAETEGTAGAPEDGAL